MPRETWTRRSDSAKSEKSYSVSRTPKKKPWPSLSAFQSRPKRLKTQTWFLSATEVSTKRPKRRESQIPGKIKTIIGRVADTAIAVEAPVENTDATAVKIIVTRNTDTADITMIENATTVTNPARAPVVETIINVVRTPTREVGLIIKKKITRDVGAPSAATRLRRVGDIRNAGEIEMIGAIGIKLSGYQLNNLAWRWGLMNMDN